MLVDSAVLEAGDVLMGSGVRGSKLLLPAGVLTALPGAEVLQEAGPPHRVTRRRVARHSRPGGRFPP